MTARTIEGRPRFGENATANYTGLGTYAVGRAGLSVARGWHPSTEVLHGQHAAKPAAQESLRGRNSATCFQPALALQQVG
jgi:hypothetical protein